MKNELRSDMIWMYRWGETCSCAKIKVLPESFRWVVKLSTWQSALYILHIENWCMMSLTTQVLKHWSFHMKLLSQMNHWSPFTEKPTVKVTQNHFTPERTKLIFIFTSLLILCQVSVTRYSGDDSANSNKHSEVLNWCRHGVGFGLRTQS